jgi:NAD(P)H-hydrate epimerase
MRIYSAKEMAEADRITIEEYGIPGSVLMENAGSQTVDAMEERYGDALYDDESAVLVLCGKGNNGGDGFVIARHLFNRGTARLDVVLLGEWKSLTADARLNHDIFCRMDGAVHEASDWESFEQLLEDGQILSPDEYTVVVDAILGTGLNSPVRGYYARVINAINEGTAPVVAVDIPSGLSADSPNPPGEAILAELTVTFGAPKYPHLLPPGDKFCGDLAVADISIPEAALERAGGGPFVVTDELAGFLLPEPRERTGHKGDYGHVLLVGGSVGKTGAAVMGAEAAYRSGAGLVTVATPADCLPVVAGASRELMTEPLAQTPAGTLSPEALPRAVALAAERDVLALGPGISADPSTGEFVRHLFAAPELSGTPMVIDADGLNAFAGEPGALDANGREAPVIITPHPGEMARLLGIGIDQLLEDRIGPVSAFARTRNLIVVLKGYRSLTVAPEGDVWVNLSGNPGMASGGSGDVLTGVIAALLGQRLDPVDAAILGVHIHGLAGDMAAEDVGELSLMAGDLLEYLPDAFLVCAGEEIEFDDEDE